MSREKGNKLETRISKDLGINLTTNSGAKYNNADLANNKIIIECKFKDKDKLSIPWKEIKKVKQQALSTGRDWIYVQENKAGTFVVIDYDMFLEIYNWVRSFKDIC